MAKPPKPVKPIQKKERNNSNQVDFLCASYRRIIEAD